MRPDVIAEAEALASDPVMCSKQKYNVITNITT